MEQSNYKIIKRKSELLEVHLNDHEIARKGEDQATKSLRYCTTKSDLKEHTKDVNADLKALEKEINVLAKDISYGKERRPVDVVHELDETTWKVRMRRVDTDEIIGERSATEKEMQQDLFSEGVDLHKEAAATADAALGTPDDSDAIQGEPVTDEEVEASIQTALAKTTKKRPLIEGNGKAALPKVKKVKRLKPAPDEVA